MSPFRILDNAKSLKKEPYDNMKHSGIKMHIGAVRSYCRHLQEVLHDRVIRHRDIDTIEVIGHSRGSLLAQIAASDLQYHYPDKEYIVRGYGLGSAGNDAYVQSQHKRIPNTLMFCYGRDIVYGICPEWAGYEKTKTAIMLGGGTGSRTEDHRPKYYKRAIGKLC
jgi:hypothetical protein